VIVLMLENRSFDHLLGFLDHPNPHDFDGVSSGEHFNVNGAQQPVRVTAGGSGCGPDPDHSHIGILEQLGAFEGVPTNGGFVRSYERAVGVGPGDEIMHCLDPMVVCPSLATLAKEFAVCTAWFSSVPGETWPNRNFAHAATSDGSVDIEFGFFYDRTIFEQLSAAGVSWRVYYDGPPQLWAFRKLWRGRTLIDFLLRRTPKIGNWFTQDQLADHIADDQLAAYTFIEPAHNHVHEDPDEPRRTNSQHPHNNVNNDDDFRAGEDLVRSIYSALLANRKLFDTTLLVVTYDEHGGLYDHVAPPAATPPGDPVDRGLVRRI
jgi:phospholipase C